MKDDRAYPFTFSDRSGQISFKEFGFTKQELAAIHLKVTRPDLEPWLNEMIEDSQRNDYAKAALTGLIFGRQEKIKTFATEALAVANAMIEEGRKGK